jgi:predicted  nucleic acid-binding Zn-ribbon protein
LGKDWLEPYKKPYTVLICHNCSRRWQYPVKRLPKLPKRCKFCKSLKWNCHTHECLRCGHGWLSRYEKPKMCPACKSEAWQRKPGDNLPTGKKPVKRLQRERQRQNAAVVERSMEKWGHLKMRLVFQIQNESGHWLTFLGHSIRLQVRSPEIANQAVAWVKRALETFRPADQPQN